MQLLGRASCKMLGRAPSEVLDGAAEKVLGRAKITLWLQVTSIKMVASRICDDEVDRKDNRQQKRENSEEV